MDGLVVHNEDKHQTHIAVTITIIITVIVIIIGVTIIIMITINTTTTITVLRLPLRICSLVAFFCTEELVKWTNLLERVVGSSVYGSEDILAKPSRYKYAVKVGWNWVTNTYLRTAKQKSN